LHITSIQAGIDYELVGASGSPSRLFSEKDDEYFVHKLVKHFETHLKLRKVLLMVARLGDQHPRLHAET